jgi:hypothetical protein
MVGSASGLLSGEKVKARLDAGQENRNCFLDDFPLKLFQTDTGELTIAVSMVFLSY